jgi:Protein of unknown function (DUF2892)
MSIAESFGRSPFARFINSTAGRLARVIAGLALIGVGYVGLGGTAGIVVAAVGMVPLTTGSLNWCLISALLGGPINGARIG